MGSGPMCPFYVSPLGPLRGRAVALLFLSVILLSSMVWLAADNDLERQEMGCCLAWASSSYIVYTYSCSP